MRQSVVLCLLLFCGGALARSMLDVDVPGVLEGVVSIDDDTVDLGFGYGEGNSRQLQSVNPYQYDYSGNFVVKVNPDTYCKNFPSSNPGTSPNREYRQVLQTFAATAGTKCGVLAPENGRFLNGLSTKCRRPKSPTGKVGKATGIAIGFKTITVKNYDADTRQCFFDALKAELAGDNYACTVNKLLAAGSPDVSRWAVTGVNCGGVPN
ncbi:hypothetical protein N2152v2_011291 [Parachlorella kessleri]